MNIKINKEQADYLLSREIHRHTVGSHLYGTNTEGSDKDYLILYKPVSDALDDIYHNRHQFQWDDTDNNIQYMFTTRSQFFMNLFSGDATINADIIMFDEHPGEEAALNICRTYNIIKAYLGFAKRDIKDWKQGKGRNKMAHIQRGLYCAKALMLGFIPSLDHIKACVYWNEQEGNVTEMESSLRDECNVRFNRGDLTMFPKLPMKGLDLKTGVANELILLYINSCNTKEFHYE